jgi:hypothetical protein
MRLVFHDVTPVSIPCAQMPASALQQYDVGVTGYLRRKSIQLHTAVVFVKVSHDVEGIGSRQWPFRGGQFDVTDFRFWPERDVQPP